MAFISVFNKQYNEIKVLPEPTTEQSKIGFLLFNRFIMKSAVFNWKSYNIKSINTLRINIHILLIYILFIYIMDTYNLIKYKIWKLLNLYNDMNQIFIQYNIKKLKIGQTYSEKNSF